MHNLEIITLGEPILFNGDSFYYNSTSNNYYDYGRHSLFISKKEWVTGYKFFVVKNVKLDKNIIQQIFNIHKLLYTEGWAVDAISIEECHYKGQTIEGLKIETAWHSASGRMPFILSDFRGFCEKVQGLDKNDNQFEYQFGKNWKETNPEWKFFIGGNNLLKTQMGKLVLVDIDPRWSLKS